MGSVAGKFVVGGKWGITIQKALPAEGRITSATKCSATVTLWVFWRDACAVRREQGLTIGN
jgi:hypothetical protein